MATENRHKQSTLAKAHLLVIHNKHCRQEEWYGLPSPYHSITLDTKTMVFTEQDRADFLNELETASQNLNRTQAEFYHAVLHQLILIATPQTIDQLIEAINRGKNVLEL